MRSIAICGLGLLLAAPLHGQFGGLELSVELTPVLGVSTGGFAGGFPGPRAGTGYGVGLGGTAGAGPIALYGGYQLLQFPCEACADTGLDEDIREVGWEVGAQAEVPVGVLPFTPWVRGGAILHQLQFRGEGTTSASEPAIGYSVGAGARFPVLGQLEVVPALRYRAYSADFEFAGTPVGTERSTRTVDVSYLTVDLGLAFRF